MIALESLTNPRLRQGTGQISLVPVARRVSGPGASVVMAPFVHTSKDRPTRFSDGSYGVYYAGHQFDTALREVAFHKERFHRATNDPATENAFRTYQGKIDATMHDITDRSRPDLLGPDVTGYPASQIFARMLREGGSNGIVYPSVRHSRGECIAAFWPDVVAIPIQTKNVTLKWDGYRISAWFDFDAKVWANL